MHCRCGTNNRVPRLTFTDPCKPEVRPGAREESASPAWLAVPAMNDVTMKQYNNEMARNRAIMLRYVNAMLRYVMLCYFTLTLLSIQVSGGVSVRFWLAAPLANFLWPPGIR